MADIPEIKQNIIDTILTGGARTMAVSLRMILNKILDSSPNYQTGGKLFEVETGYKGTFRPSSAGAFATVDMIGGSLDPNDYIRIDGASIPTTGDINIGDNFGFFTTDSNKTIASNVNLAGELYQMYYQDNSSQRFWGINIRPTLYQLMGNSTDGGLAYNHIIGSNTYSYGCAGDVGAISFDLSNITDLRNYQYQDKDGTFAFLSDVTNTVSGYLPLTGGTLTGNLNGVTPAEISYLSGGTSNFQNQLNNIKSGLSWKVAARVIVGSNVNIASPGATLDGVTMAAGDRVVLNGQSTGSQNGVYLWNGSTVPMTRTVDTSTGGTGDTGVLGMTIAIEEGSSADQIFILTNNAPIVVGTTSLVFAKSSATTYTGSNGIVLTGNNFAFDYTTLSATSPLLYNSSTHVFSMQPATAVQNGYLLAGDYVTFNNKISSQWTTQAGPTISYGNSVMIGDNSAPITKLSVVDTSTAALRGISSYQYSTTGSAQWNGLAANGTLLAPTAVAAGRVLTNMNAWGHDGTQFTNSGSIRFTAIGTVSNAIVPTTMELRTMTAVGVLTTGLTMAQDQKITLSTLNNGVVISTAGVLSNAAVSNIEIGYVTGVTSPIQTQLSTKATIGGTDTTTSTYVLGTASAFSTALRTNGVDRFTVDSTGNIIQAGVTTTMSIPILRILDQDGVTWRTSAQSITTGELRLGTGWTVVVQGLGWTTTNATSFALGSPTMVSRSNLLAGVNTTAGLKLGSLNGYMGTDGMIIGGLFNGATYLTTVNAAYTAAPTPSTKIITAGNSVGGGSGNLELSTGTVSGGAGTRGVLKVGLDAAQQILVNGTMSFEITSGLVFKTGTNARAGSSTLASGSVTVANTSITANSQVVITARHGTTVFPMDVTYNAGVGFTINSTSVGDTRIVDWFIIERN